MSTLLKQTDTKLLNRRLLLKLAVASIFLATGCTNTRQESDLDAAMSDLNRKLDEIDDNERLLKLVSIAQRIKASTRELATEHRTFTDNFDQLLGTYDATEDQLEQLIETYNRQRALLRNSLLHLQDELHAAMTPDEWAEVVQVLNQAGKSLANYTFGS